MSLERFVRFVLKPLVFLAALGPVTWLIWAFQTDNLSVNPLSDITNETGIWTLRFLCITLAITPLRRITGWNALIKFRRMTGLVAFFYGTLHFLTYIVFDRFAGLVEFPAGIVSMETARRLAESIASDIAGERPFITVGFSAWVLMLPLALTSTAWAIRKLGKKWSTLHTLVYGAGCLGVVHYWWLVKADVSRPQVYAAIVGALLLFRLLWRHYHETTKAAKAARSTV